MSEVSTYVDASHFVDKANLWEETDEFIKMNNTTLAKAEKDKQAKICCKGVSKY